MVCSLDCIALLVLCYSIRFSRTLRDILGVKTCEVFLCFLTIIFLGSIVLTSHRLLCMNCFTSLVRFTGFCTEYIWAHLDQCMTLQRGCLKRRRIALRTNDSNEVRAGGKIFCFLFFSYCWSSLFPARPLPCLRVCSIDCITELRLNRINSRNHLWLGSSLDHTQWF